MNNFRGIRELKLEFHDQTNILVGENGSGKSSVLDCMAVMLSRLFYRIRPTKGTGRLFTEKDITNGESGTENEISLLYKKQPVTWPLNKRRSGRTRTYYQEQKIIIDDICEALERDENANLPLAVYYPVNRAVFDIPLRIREKPSFDQLSAYDQALTGGRGEFRKFFGWFRNREDLENERRIRKPRHRDPQLQAVRDAIEHIRPNFTQLHVRRSPLRMVLQKGKEELVVDQLSDGEKCLLAMVGDLARRLAIANPSLKKPLEGHAIVLIDEIDLHLHPEWQRMIVPALEKTFPNCQFFLTTHSPQILSHVQAESIIILKRSGKETQAVQPERSYGHDSNRLLEDIMGVPERPQKTKNELDRLFSDIEEGKLDRARNRLEKLDKQLGADPALVKADVLLHRMEIMNQ